MKTTIAERLNLALETVQSAVRCANRPAGSVRLLAVSKTKPVDMVKDAYAAGQRAFGENYVQEGIAKIQTLSELDDIEWHLIGPLQSNKCKPVAEHFDWVQSVDRLKVAKRLSDNRPAGKPALNLCLQVNISAEGSKSGVTLPELPALAEQVAALPNIRLRGIMAIPSNTQDSDKLVAEFAAMRGAFAKLQQQYDSIDTLSMGMSADMATAIAQGSTMVRVGTAIFGKRN